MKFKISLFATPDNKADDGLKYHAICPGHKYMMDDQDIHLEDVETYITIPEFDKEELLQRAIATLQDKQANAYAEAERKVLHFQRLINQLQLLEHNPDPDALKVVGEDTGVPF